MERGLHEDAIGSGDPRSPRSTLLPHSQRTTPACLPTIPGHIQLHELHEVSHFRRQPLDLVVTEAQLSQVQ